jgi:hypothetical protein
MPVLQHSDARTDGQSYGQSASDKQGFFGVTPVIQPASATQAAITAGATATATTALVIELRTALVNLGLIKGAA